MLNYSEQVYDILVREIEAGRWELNDQLPGVVRLAKELDFGTKTIQIAYDRLKEEGYVESLGYRGTFLKSLRSKNNFQEGAIGILVSREQSTEPLMVWYEHVIGEFFRARGLGVELKICSSNQSQTLPHTWASLFRPQTVGVISLMPFHCSIHSEREDKVLPLVFLCPPYEQCQPAVSADIYTAYFELTKRVIACGHHNILYSEDLVEPEPRQVEMHRRAFHDAMHLHGLPVDSQSLADSHGIDNDSDESVGSYWERILSQPAARRPTAVVCGSLGRSMALGRVALLRNLSVPEEMSLVSIGSAPLPGSNNLMLTGMLPDFDSMIGKCHQLLLQQQEQGTTEFSRYLSRMNFVPGDTLNVINGYHPEDEPKPFRPLKHDARKLSGMVAYPYRVAE